VFLNYIRRSSLVSRLPVVSSSAKCTIMLWEALREERGVPGDGQVRC
jgi:hypothetical protein